MSTKDVPSSKELRKLAAEIRKEAQKVEKVKLIKCAKYVVGMTALAQLERKLRSI